MRTCKIHEVCTCTYERVTNIHSSPVGHVLPGIKNKEHPRERISTHEGGDCRPSLSAHHILCVPLLVIQQH